MNLSIHSRKDIQPLIEGALPENTAVISFYSPQRAGTSDYRPVNYLSKPERLFYVCIPDIDIQTLPSFGLTYDTYLANAAELAEFIIHAVQDGLDIICQCDYGQSRSAACAAAILEYFESRGISIFADYRYYPNQLVFNKIYEALNQNAAGKHPA